jgi:2'-5' RNA ligase
MPFAVTLRLDSATDTAIQALWNKLAAGKIDRERRDLGYGAHITLGIYPDQIPSERLCELVEFATASWNALPIVLSGFGVFPGVSSIVWIAPAPSSALIVLHGEMHAALEGNSQHPHYRPGAWTPHITLTGPLMDPASALGALTPLWQPLTGVLDRVELVHFRPVTTLWTRALQPLREVGMR